MGGNTVKPLKDQHDVNVEVDSFDGPIKNRQCRDVLFLILFVAFLGGMGYTSYLTFKSGPPECLKLGNIDKCKSCPFNICFPKDLNVSNILITFGISDQKMMNDLKTTWKEICYMILLTVGVVLVLCVLLRFFAGFIIWTIVIFVPLATCSVCIYAWITYNYYQQNPPDPNKDPGTFKKPKTWLTISITMTAITVIFLLIILVLRKRICLVVQLFKEAGKSLGSMPLLFLQPVWTFIIAIGCVAGLVYIFIAIDIAGDLNAADHSNADILKYLKWYHIFGSIWIFCYIVSCHEFVIASCVSMWYFCREKKSLSFPILKSIYRLIRFHLGSIALGSFLVALLKMVRLVLAIIERRLKNSAGSVAAFILKCCQCCLWCFEKLIKFINRNAYIEIAIHGFGFCKAARSAFMIIVNNALRLTAINSVGDFVLIIAKVGTVIAAGGVGYELIKNNKDINYIWLPIATICIISYLIAACFFSVYEMAIDTLFICFCEDCDMNDGISKPYFMSKDLMKYVQDSKIH